MPRASNGVYTLPNTVNPVVTNTTITSNWANTTLADIESVLTSCLDRAGRGAMQANLQMGGFKVTGAADGTAGTDLVTKGQMDAVSGVVATKLDASAVSAFGLDLIDSADAAAARATLDVPTRTGGDASGIWPISISGNAATVTNGVYTVGDQAIQGVKYFETQLGSGGELILWNGSNIAIRAGSGDDSGDIIFQNSSAAEIGRLSRDLGSAQFVVRFSSSDTNKVLTHNENIGSHTAALGVGGIGTYALLKEDNATNRAPGDLLAGSALQYSPASGAIPAIAYASGTWRCMGFKYGGATPTDRVTLWLRVA